MTSVTKVSAGSRSSASPLPTQQVSGVGGVLNGLHKQLLSQEALLAQVGSLEQVLRPFTSFSKQTWVLQLMQQNPRGWKSRILETDPSLRGKTEVPAGYLRDVDLSGKNLQDVDLANMDLSQKNLSGTDLRGADLRWANLNKADLRQVMLLTSLGDLVGANFSQVNLSRTDLRGVNLTGINLMGAKLPGAYLSGATLTNANLKGAILAGATIEDAKLMHTNLTDALMQGVFLRGSNLRGAILDGANLVAALVTPDTFQGVGSMKWARLEAMVVDRNYGVSRP